MVSWPRSPFKVWQIEASDISHRMLERAQQGIYPLDTGHTLAPELLRRYFQRGVGVRAEKCRVKAELRQRVLDQYAPGLKKAAGTLQQGLKSLPSLKQ